MTNEAVADHDLTRRLRAMASRWHYADEEVAEALRQAKTDPTGWLQLVEHEEALAGGNGGVDV